jgi:hypothetical protein
MPDLVFNNVNQYWQGNDYKDIPARAARNGQPARPAEYHHISMTSVALGNERPFALIFMTHMNVDFDGAPNAYGPSNLDPLDNIGNAINDATGHYVGLMSVKPTARNPVDANGMIKAPDGTRVKVDPSQPDRCGCLPVVQQTGQFAGYYVSTTSRSNPEPGASHSLYEQSHYLDSGSVSFCALHTGIEQEGVRGGDLGIAIRLDNFRTASFNFLDGEGGSGKTYDLAECSYRVFLDIGGRPKRRAEAYPNNNFPTCFVVFPGSKYFPHMNIGLADNPGDFAAFIAFQGQVDAVTRGASGVARFNEWVAGGRASQPAHSDAIYVALARYIPFML